MLELQHVGSDEVVVMARVSSAGRMSASEHSLPEHLRGEVGTGF